MSAGAAAYVVVVVCTADGARGDREILETRNKRLSAVHYSKATLHSTAGTAKKYTD